MSGKKDLKGKLLIATVGIAGAASQKVLDKLAQQLEQEQLNSKQEEESDDSKEGDSKSKIVSKRDRKEKVKHEPEEEVEMIDTSSRRIGKRL